MRLKDPNVGEWGWRLFVCWTGRQDEGPGMEMPDDETARSPPKECNCTAYCGLVLSCCSIQATSEVRRNL